MLLDFDGTQGWAMLAASAKQLPLSMEEFPWTTSVTVFNQERLARIAGLRSLEG